MFKKTRKSLVNPKNSSCPVCGSFSVEVHKLGNGNYGKWCTNCLQGVPCWSYINASTESKVNRDYDNWKNLVLKFGHTSRLDIMHPINSFIHNK